MKRRTLRLVLAAAAAASCASPSEIPPAETPFARAKIAEAAALAPAESAPDAPATLRDPALPARGAHDPVADILDLGDPRIAAFVAKLRDPAAADDVLATTPLDADLLLAATWVRSPAVAAARADAEAMRRAFEQARWLEDVETRFRSLGVPAANVRGEMDAAPLGYPGDAALRGEMLDREVEMAAARLRMVFLEQGAAAVDAYHVAAHHVEELEIRKAQVEVLARLVDAARARVESGRAPQAELLEAEAELAMVRNDRTHAEEALVQARRGLNARLDRAPDAPCEFAPHPDPPETTPGAPELLGLARRSSPAIAMARADAARIAAAERMAHRMASPTRGPGAIAGGMSGIMDGAAPDAVSPAWAAELSARRAAAERRVDEATRDVERKVADAAFELSAMSRMFRVAAHSTEPATRQALDERLRLYEGGGARGVHGPARRVPQAPRRAARRRAGAPRLRFGRGDALDGRRRATGHAPRRPTMTDPDPGAPAPRRSALVTALRILSVRLRFIGLLVLVMVVAATWDDLTAYVERLFRTAGHDHGPAAGKDAAGETEWFCPMHPHVIRGEPASCPICGMPLSKRKKAEAATLPDGVVARISLSPYRVAQAGVRTSPVEWRPLEREVSTVGFLEFDERRLASIAARFPGRVTYVNPEIVTGAAVEKGKPILTLWSPELFSAEAAFVSARAAAAASPEAARSAESARRKLAAWGLTDEQIEQVAAAGQAFETVNVLAPASGVVTKRSVVAGDYVQEGSPLFDVADLGAVWLLARVYEDDLPLVTVGRKVTATTTAYRDQPIEGVVAFVEPTVDRASRTVAVRVELPNPDGRLRPGMFTTATIRVPLADLEPWKSAPKPPPGAPRTVYWCPMHPEVVQDAPGECTKCGGMKLVAKQLPSGPQPGDVLAVPETAVVDTGARRLVYVESSEGVFDAREVVLGPRAGAFYPVIRGVEPGMRVATAGSFLLDAETRLDPAAAGTYFGATGTPAAGTERSK